MTDRELLAIFEKYAPQHGNPEDINNAIEALRARLAQPEQEIESDRPHVEDDGCPTEKAVLQRFWREHQKQEPVAVFCREILGRGQIFWLRSSDELPNETPLYTAQPQREWQGLTDEEILEEYRQSYGDDGNLTDVYFAHAIEAKLKEKNA